MWLFISRRFRRWMLLSIFLPLARFVVQRGAARTSARNPDSKLATSLRWSERKLSRKARRK